jgi:hypothetical protein
MLLGTISGALAAAPTTGIAEVDAVIAQYYNAVETACTGPTADVAACEAALEAYAALATPEGVLALPGVAGLVSPEELSAAMDASYAQAYTSSQTVLNATIRSENASNPLFLASIEDALIAGTGFGSGAGEDEQSSSATIPG